ncbi:hypothetical protein [Rufibacter quisquiliarum]|uniref:Uncharacterized protein n=1 Tax=Rufibacter quisquiliarum TaxID=1549639 RepID=A0A839GLT2_9BACT|nr:hypothetical protein [Rufibacter quisquiliarum]MBA9079782.1 hypothetical protein [Rufibacter quisquiliarum]
MAEAFNAFWRCFSENRPKTGVPQVAICSSGVKKEMTPEGPPQTTIKQNLTGIHCSKAAVPFLYFYIEDTVIVIKLVGQAPAGEGVQLMGNKTGSLCWQLQQEAVSLCLAAAGLVL